MYHHRYQPQTSHLAKRNSNSFASNNHRSSNLKPNNNQVSVDVGPRTIGNYNSSSTGAPINHSFKFGNQNKSNTNSAYHSGAYSSQPRQFAEERQDVIFRRVRGILNKITPETFDKLSKELVNVGLDSPRTLRGLIYLLFDKALKDLKYSSLYAKLCQELSEKAPNFEQEPGPNTFCKFLISKCEDEFERRRKATEDFDLKNELTDEEFEQKAIAKQKMLGNIKFICELGKKRLLQEEILHECIRGLLSKKKERPIQDQTQDLECLCQIMRTIGSLLDIDASRNLMNQYFERIDMYSRKPELPSRIRFMLKDVIDLRNNKWRPRPFQKEDNVPQPLSKLREEAGFHSVETHTSIDRIGNNRNLKNLHDLSKMNQSKLSSIMMEDDGPSFTTSTDFHWGSNTFMPHETEFDIFSSTMPAYNKIITNTSSKNRINSTNSSQANTNTATVSKHQLAIDNHQRKHEAYYNNNNNGTTTRIDPFSDSFKTNKLVQNNRSRVSEDHPLESHDLNKRADIVHRHDENYQVRESLTPHSQSGHDKIHSYDQDPAILRSSREKPLSGQSRGNNAVHNKPAMELRNGPPLDDSTSHNSRKSFGDPSRQTFVRKGGLSPIPRFSNPQRNLGGGQLPLPAPAAAAAQNHDLRQPQNPSRNSRPGLESGHRPEPRFMHGAPNDMPGARESRFERNIERHEREPRQPKFSGANYRLPGRERPAPRDLNRADYIPESELNTNWRSAGLKKHDDCQEHNAVSKRFNDSVAPPLRASGQHAPSRDNSKLVCDAGVTDEDRVVSRKLGELGSEKGKSNCVVDDKLKQSAKREQREGLANVLPLSQTGLNQSASPRTNPQPIMHRSDNFKPYEQLPEEDKFRPRNLVNQDPFAIQPRNSGPPARPNQHDITGKKDRERNTQRRHQVESEPDHRQPARTKEEPERRNFKPEFGRHQSFEAQSNDQHRSQNWRRDIQPQLPVKKEQVPPASLVSSPLFAKPPVRMSETDFSLRPSHNLAGRAFTEVPNHRVLAKPSEKTAETQSNKNTDSNARPAADGSIGNKQGVSTQHDKALDHQSKSIAEDQHITKFNSSLSQSLSEDLVDVQRLASSIKELKIPKGCQSDCLVSAMKQLIIGSESDRDNISKLLVSLVPSIFEQASLLSAFKVIFEQLHGLEAETPKVKSLVADSLSRTVVDGLLSLEDVAGVLAGGKHHPLFLLLLQKLEKKGGQAWLSKTFIASKINLIDMLPEVDRSKERLASALKDRCLGFLDPMLTIEPDLWEQMKEREASPAAIYRWIKDNVDLSIQNTPTFAHVFIACLMKYIHETCTDRCKNDNRVPQKETGLDDSSKSSPTNSSSQNANDFEKELLTKYQQVLQAILKDKQMQLASLYALQSFYHGLDFPKGALLRWFHMLYDMSIVDDDVFFIWKEEINDEFPGKGQALFQVNTWLNWLAEPDSEDDEDG